MELSLFDREALSAGIMLILAAGTLTLGGGMLISRAVRMRRELIGNRVELATGGRRAITTTPDITAAAGLVRNPEETVVQRELARRLGHFGIPAGRVLLVFAGVQILAGLCFASLALLIGTYVAPTRFSGLPALLVATLLGFIGWYVPVLAMEKLAKSRINDVAIALPEALELLVICAEAGLALGDGVDRIVRELRSSQPALAEELAQTAADLKILPSRELALANFAERVNLPAVRSVVTTLSQTMRYGTPLAQAMRVVAAEMRNESLIHLEERANRLPALLTIPMMLFIMPTIFLVVGGPAALKLIEVMAH